MVTVEYPEGSLSQAQKDDLAEEMTHVLLEIEGGADTPDGRSIAWVRFQEIPATDWYIGGTTGDKYVSAAGKFLIELNVPEGSMDQARKSEAHRAINDAFLRVTGTSEKAGAGRSVSRSSSGLKDTSRPAAGPRACSALQSLPASPRITRDSRSRTHISTPRIACTTRTASQRKLPAARSFATNVISPDFACRSS